MGSSASTQILGEADADAVAVDGVASVESFLAEIFDHGNKFSAVGYLCAVESSKSHLKKYMESDFSVENLNFYEAIDGLAKVHTDLLGPSTFRKLYEKFLIPGADGEVNLSSTLRKKFRMAFEDEETSMNNAKLMSILETARSEILAIIAMNAYPRFLKSHDYIDWRENEMLLSANFTTFKADARLNTVISTAMSHVDPKEIDYILQKSVWFKHFISCAENLPHAVMIARATANADSGEYFIIYANIEFSEMSGYDRDSVLGKNAVSLLRGLSTEEVMVDQISKAYASALPVQLEMSNYKKNGDLFKNLITQRPILDDTKTARYVISLQSPASGAVYKAFSAKVLSLIPERL